MKQEQIVALFYQSKFAITEGEFSGKQTMIVEIDFNKKEIVTATSKRFSFSSIKPVLKDIKSISLKEAQEIYRLYWDNEKTYTNEDFIINKVDENNVIYKVFNIWNGKDYVAGDRIEWGNVIEYCIDNSIDCFDLIKQNKAVKQ